MYIYDFITYVDGVVIELKNVKLFTENSEYLKLRCIFYIIRLNRSIVYDIEHSQQTHDVVSTSIRRLYDVL